MTIINCSENCIYQQDGKCCFENICEHKIKPNPSCAYFTESSFNHSVIQIAKNSGN